MINQVLLVGRLVQDPEIFETKDGKILTKIRLAVQRPFKSKETDEYEADFLNCTLWETVAENTAKYVGKGSVISVKGRLVERSRELDDEKKIYFPEIVAEKVTFIAKGKNKEEK